MSLKLPPLPVSYANDRPIPLMSLKLPPLPEAYTSGLYSQQSQSQATQDLFREGKNPCNSTIDMGNVCPDPAQS